MDEFASPYHEVFAGLANVVLEASWVLSVDASLTQLTFALDLALTPAHPDYSRPERGEARCYRNGMLVLESDMAVILRRSSLLPAIDAVGDTDYGHIDTFCPTTRLRGGAWELSGDWGEAIVRQPRVPVQLNGATGS
ncbi:hypothetical protein F6X68_10275 [Micromonospora sp. AMSO12t]|uniref:hypothetical protein n=1 Tax=Micromonospora sp. AMSO12t TaxID=2650410 RepID=UPI00124BC615|nr:hypothetical protein [Micromonospora sp. AMSO12t]KAB1158763.1 hypothetical protein F6X68_10275 [Micromonospora sp. AMSO12t]